MPDIKIPLTVIMPVKNEAANLRRSLPAVSWANEVFVVDSESTDDTGSVARESGAELVQFKFNGVWPKKKNWALDNLPISNEWVLLLDADEVLGEDSREEIAEITSTNSRGFDGYFINRRFIFMGKWLKHSYYPNWILRLFKHERGRFEKLTDMPTASGDVEIHEHIILEGRAGHLLCEMDHYAFPTVDEFIKKHNRYSSWEATIEANPEKSYISRDLGSRKNNLVRSVKKASKKFPFRPFLRFFYIYILQGGFKDGVEGYYFARLHAFYEFLCCSKAYELRKAKKKP